MNEAKYLTKKVHDLEQAITDLIAEFKKDVGECEVKLKTVGMKTDNVFDGKEFTPMRHRVKVTIR